MSIYKRTVRGKPTRNYYFDFVDEEGRKRTLSSGTSDKRAAERLKRARVDRVRAIRDGLLDPSELRYGMEARKALRSHVADYVAACRGRGDVPKWIEEKKRHLEWLVGAVQGAALDRIRADEFDERLTAAAEAGDSARSVNLKLEAANAFLTWCVRNGRLRSNPLRVIQRRNQVIAPVRMRRVLTKKEAQALIAVARVQASNVPDAGTRPLWYLFPLLAGLRRSDMIRVAWRDLDLDARPPTLTIRGGKARRRVDVLPLHRELVRELRRIKPIAALPAAPIFPAAVTHETRRKDFERAGIPLKTTEGHADLHSLRHTFGTRLAEQGVPMAKLQRLMRHASVQMTMAYYVHLDVEALDQGLAALTGIESYGPRSTSSAS